MIILTNASINLNTSNLIDDDTFSNTSHYDNFDDFDLKISQANFAIMLFGIIGNIICILVFFQKPLLSRKFNWYLLILAFAELFFCIIVFINSLLFLIRPKYSIFDLNKVTCLATDFATNSTDAFCVLLTLILSIDRLYAILNPINSKRFFTNLYPKRIAFFGYLMLLCLKSPEIFLSLREFRKDLDYTFITINLYNKTAEGDVRFCRSMEPSTSRKEANVIICGIILPLSLHFMPAILILISNIILAIYVRRHSSKPDAIIVQSSNICRRSLTVTQKSHYFTIIILGVWLLITSIPYYTFYTAYMISELKMFQNSTYKFDSYNAQALVSVFFNSNHCINIVIYLLFHKSFRINSFKLLLKLCKLQNKHSSNSFSRSTNTCLFRSSDKYATATASRRASSCQFESVTIEVPTSYKFSNSTQSGGSIFNLKFRDGNLIATNVNGSIVSRTIPNHRLSIDYTANANKEKSAKRRTFYQYISSLFESESNGSLKSTLTQTSNMVKNRRLSNVSNATFRSYQVNNANTNRRLSNASNITLKSNQNNNSMKINAENGNYQSDIMSIFKRKRKKKEIINNNNNDKDCINILLNCKNINSSNKNMNNNNNNNNNFDDNIDDITNKKYLEPRIYNRRISNCSSNSSNNSSNSISNNNKTIKNNASDYQLKTTSPAGVNKQNDLNAFKLTSKIKVLKLELHDNCNERDNNNTNNTSETDEKTNVNDTGNNNNNTSKKSYLEDTNDTNYSTSNVR